MYSTIPYLHHTGSCKGIVEVVDENDVPPKWSRHDWLIEVEERDEVDTNLAFLTVKDPDVYNDFHFRVSSPNLE